MLYCGVGIFLVKMGGIVEGMVMIWWIWMYFFCVGNVF